MYSRTFGDFFFAFSSLKCAGEQEGGVTKVLMKMLLIVVVMGVMMVLLMLGNIGVALEPIGGALHPPLPTAPMVLLFIYRYASCFMPRIELATASNGMSCSSSNMTAEQLLSTDIIASLR